MTRAGPSAVAEIISLAGGQVVGRTRLQKSACVLELTGLGYGFLFSYKHFGPYSEQLKIACGDAEALDLVEEKTERASWGGWYSVYMAPRVEGELPEEQSIRQRLLTITTEADSVQLELAVTAAFLAAHKIADPWKEVESRKPTKASPDNLAGAKKLYQTLRAVQTPRALPAIAWAIVMALITASHMLPTINV